MTQSPKVLIMTASGAYNLGDECILSREIEILRDIFPMSEITVVTYDEKSLLSSHSESVSCIPYFPSGIWSHPWANISYLWKNIVTIACADILVIGGGGIFFSTLGEKSLRIQIWQWFFRILLAHIFRTRVFFWSISIEIPEPHLHYLLEKLFIFKSDIVSVRDIASQKILETLGIKTHLIPDPVIGYSGNLATIHESIPRKKIGIALRHGYLQNERENVIKIVGLIEHLGYEAIFLSFSLHPGIVDENDFKMFQELANYLNIEITSSLHQTLSILPDIQIMVAMRLHAAIIATSMGIPTQVISYASKTREFAYSFSLPIIDSKDFSFSQFEKNLIEIIENKQSIREILLSNTNKLSQKSRKELHSIFLQLFPYGK